MSIRVVNARYWSHNTHCQWRRQGGVRGGSFPPPWVDVQKLCNMCVLSLSWNFSYHTTNTLQGRRAKIHVDTQTIQLGLGTSYSRPPINPYLTSPPLQNPGGDTAYCSTISVLLHTHVLQSLVQVLHVPLLYYWSMFCNDQSNSFS